VNAIGPNFLGIGAQKAATNWVWHNLKLHPDVWMPPIKELHYFDRSLHYPSPSYLVSPGIATRLFGRQRHNSEFRRVFFRPLASSLLHGRWGELRWRLKHFFGRYDDRWYMSLFDTEAEKVRGEITPSYSILDAQDVSGIKSLLPDLKVILILRNPIDRAWSHIRFDWTTGRFSGIDSLNIMKAFIDSPNQQLRGDYIRTIDNWGAHFPKEQFFIGFYDDIMANPGKLLCELCSFLGIAQRSYSEMDNVGDRIFASRGKQLPDELRRYLAEKYRPEIERLSARIGGHTTSWLADVDRILTC
jgi:hypothetical protein